MGVIDEILYRIVSRPFFHPLTLSNHTDCFVVSSKLLTLHVERQCLSGCSCCWQHCWKINHWWTFNAKLIMQKKVKRSAQTAIAATTFDKSRQPTVSRIEMNFEWLVFIRIHSVETKANRFVNLVTGKEMSGSHTISHTHAHTHTQCMKSTSTPRTHKMWNTKRLILPPHKSALFGSLVRI